ncbi:hypothetical protein D9M69_581010 [compost metagenome]
MCFFYSTLPNVLCPQEAERIRVLWEHIKCLLQKRYGVIYSLRLNPLLCLKEKRAWRTRILFKRERFGVFVLCVFECI